jgi:hypothetical protein
MIRSLQIGLYVCAEFHIRYQIIRIWTAAADRTPALVENALLDSFEPAGITARSHLKVTSSISYIS